MFWDKDAAEQLLEERYPWFLETWRMYPRVVHRGGANLASAVDTIRVLPQNACPDDGKQACACGLLKSIL